MSILSHTWGVGLMDDYGTIVEWRSAREIWRNSGRQPYHRGHQERHRNSPWFNPK